MSRVTVRWFFLMLLSIGCAAPAAQSVEQVLATFGDEEVMTLEELKGRHPALASFFGLGATVDETQVKLEDLVFGRLLAREARRIGLENQPEVQIQIEEILAVAFLKHRIPREKLVVGPEAVDAYYAANKEKYRVPRRFRAAHILLESEAQASEVLRALEGGKAFSELAVERSIDPATAAKGGALGWVDPNKLAPPLGEVALALEPGQVSGVVRSPFGYHLIRLEEKAPVEYRSLDLMRQALHEELVAKKQQKLVDAVKQELWAKYSVTIDQERLREAVLTVQDTNAGGTVNRVEGPKEGPAPRLQLLSRVFELAPIPAETTLYRMLLRNSGDAELTVRGVRSDCRCLRPGVKPSTNLAPGEGGELIFRLDPERLAEEGRTTLAIAIDSNDPQAPETLVRIRVGANKEKNPNDKTHD